MKHCSNPDCTVRVLDFDRRPFCPLCGSAWGDNESVELKRLRELLGLLDFKPGCTTDDFLKTLLLIKETTE